MTASTPPSSAPSPSISPEVAHALAISRRGCEELLPEADWERLFTPFLRLDDSRTRASGGHGLGLSIVRRIIYWHAGRALIGRSESLGGLFQLGVAAPTSRARDARLSANADQTQELFAQVYKLPRATTARRPVRAKVS